MQFEERLVRFVLGFAQTHGNNQEHAKASELLGEFNEMVASRGAGQEEPAAEEVEESLGGGQPVPDGGAAATT